MVFPENGAIAEIYLEDESKTESSCTAEIESQSQVYRIVLLGYDLYNNAYWKRSFTDSEFNAWEGYGLYP
jgi:hypothetical protein